MRIISMRFATIAGLVLLLQGAASADVVLISGSGTWDTVAPTTPVSAPGATWSFSFDATTPIASDGTTTFSNFSYLLNGSSVSETLTAVQFFSTGDFGLFSLFLADGNFLGFYGAQVYDTTSNLISGIYPAAIDVNQTALPLGVGTGVIHIGAVPEPSSIVSAAIGLVLIGGFASRRRRPAA
jgi:hypothetical protein